jgi:hypothetical protein
MPITPDAKDWTWVIEERCPECGFDAATTACTDVAPMLRAAIEDWFHILTTRADARARPSADKWSPTEYGCHVRDVFRVYEGRVQRMLTEDGPHYENWDQDETAITDDYASQEAAEVAHELVGHGAAIAKLFESVHGDQWQRTGFRGDGAAFTIDTISRYFLHDIVHHLWDVHA